MNISVMRSDRRKNPEQVAYEFLTFEECKNLGSHSYVLDDNGKIAEVKITSVKTWKTRPNELLVGWKFGLYEYGKYPVYNDMEKCSNGFFIRIVPLIGHDEMRAIRRDLINYHLQNTVPNMRTTVFMLRDIKFLVRNGEVYRHGRELKSYE